MTAFPALAPRDWRDSAACQATDPDLFFPAGAEGPALAQAAQAKRVCMSCPVRRACLDWALRHRQESGVWGGTTEQERAALGYALVAGAPSLCQSGRHLRGGSLGRCRECKRERDGERELARVRDQSGRKAAARARDLEGAAA